MASETTWEYMASEMCWEQKFGKKRRKAFVVDAGSLAQNII